MVACAKCNNEIIGKKYVINISEDPNHRYKIYICEQCYKEAGQ